MADVPQDLRMRLERSAAWSARRIADLESELSDLRNEQLEQARLMRQLEAENERLREDLREARLVAAHANDCAAADLAGRKAAEEELARLRQEIADGAADQLKIAEMRI